MQVRRNDTLTVCLTTNVVTEMMMDHIRETVYSNALGQDGTCSNMYLLESAEKDCFLQNTAAATEIQLPCENGKKRKGCKQPERHVPSFGVSLIKISIVVISSAECLLYLQYHKQYNLPFPSLEPFQLISWLGPAFITGQANGLQNLHLLCND